MSDVAIRVEGLSKQYRLGQRQRYKALRDTLSSAFSAPVRAVRSLFKPARPPEQESTFWALRDLSCEIKKGQAVGIIGHNGAGKSTLLKILSRITEPTSGRAEIRGRVGSLLEVGTGFHPELTGRENTYLSGAILGMRKREIDRKFDQIVSFAEMERFIDTPVKFYSSGMYVRLAFAVAAHLEPEVLLVDEVLAVGDAAFQKKCMGKMDDVTREGRTILFVSHNMGAINKLCPWSIWLSGGELKAFDRSDVIIDRYLASAYDASSFRQFADRPGARAQLRSVRLLDREGRETTDFACGESPVVDVEFTLRERVRGMHVACIVTTSEGYHLFSTADSDLNPERLEEERAPGTYRVQAALPTGLLNTGLYHVAIGMGIPGVESFDRQEAVSFTLHDAGDFGTMKEGARRAGLLLVQAPWRYLSSRGYSND